MKYFRLSQDKRLKHSVLIGEPQNIAGYYEAKNGDYSGLDDVILCNVNLNAHNYYPDILDRQLYMVKEAVKEVFDMFMPDIGYKSCCFYDAAADRYEVYHIPMLEVMDLPQAEEYRPHIFLISDTKEIEVAASLDVVEAVLRRKPEGVRVVLVDC